MPVRHVFDTNRILHKTKVAPALEAKLLHIAENEIPCIVYELPVCMAGEGEWYNSQ